MYTNFLNPLTLAHFAPLLAVGLAASGCDPKVTDFKESETESTMGMTTGGDLTDSESTTGDEPTGGNTTGGDMTTGSDMTGGNTTGGDMTTGSDMTGGNTTGGNMTTGDSQGGCGMEIIELVEDLEASIPEFEGTPAEVLAAIQGPKQGTFIWPEDPEFVTTPYDGTSSPLAFELTPTGDVRLIEVELHGNFPDGQEGGQLCSNTLEFDANLTFTTDDGVFALNEPTVIRMRVFGDEEMPGKPSLYHTIGLANNAGTLQADDFIPTAGEFAQAILTGSFTETTIKGVLLVEVEGDGWIGAGGSASFDAN